MNIEDELRGALDVSAPLPTTTLDHVMKRGRRRVFARRAGAVAGAAAVVAVLGLVTTMLPTAVSTSPAGPQTLPTSPPPSNQNGWVTGWPEIDAPMRAPETNWTPTSPSPGWQQVNARSQCTPKPRSTPLTVPFGGVTFTQDQRIDLLERTVKEVLSSEATKVRYEDNYQLIELGEGSLTITAGKFAGAPMTAASDGVWDTAGCTAGFRTTLPDGTVLELKAVTASGAWTLSQVLLVYRADGKVIKLEQNNFGIDDVDLKPGGPGAWRINGPLQPRLPMEMEQFEKLGPAVAAAE